MMLFLLFAIIAMELFIDVYSPSKLNSLQQMGLSGAGGKGSKTTQG